MFGVIIANFNGAKLLEVCLDSIKVQDYKNYSIYVVDNGSTDDSIEIINQYKDELRIELICNDSNKGFALANNQGISKAIEDGCNYIITLNNDIELSKDAFINIDKHLKLNRNYNVFQIMMLNYYNKETIDALGVSIDKKLLATPIGVNKNINEFNYKEIYIDGPCAGAAVYSVQALEKVRLKKNEYFDSNFFAYYEDVDLALRLKKAGFQTQLIENGIAYHMYSSTSKKISGLKQYYSARNLFLYAKRNQSKKSYKKNFKNYFMLIFKRILYEIYKGEYRVVKYEIKGLFDGIRESKNLQ